MQIRRAIPFGTNLVSERDASRRRAISCIVRGEHHECVRRISDTRIGVIDPDRPLFIVVVIERVNRFESVRFAFNRNTFNGRPSLHVKARKGGFGIRVSLASHFNGFVAGINKRRISRGITVKVNDNKLHGSGIALD